MQRCDSPSGTDADGLHTPFYTRPATPLKRKVWPYCIKSCRAAQGRDSVSFEGRFPIAVFTAFFHPFLTKTAQLLAWIQIRLESARFSQHTGRVKKTISVNTI
jgi:hypothetical protein